MPKKWCINCQKEVEERYIFGHDYGECDSGNCNHPCLECGHDALASIQPNSNHSDRATIKQMTGEAQRIAQRTGKTGDIEVTRTTGNASSDYQTQVLVYNTYTRQCHFSRR